MAKASVCRRFAGDGPAGRRVLGNEAFASVRGKRLLARAPARSWTQRVGFLGGDHGRYSFREWTLPFTPAKSGPLVLEVHAFNRIGQTQPMDAPWNPSGNMRNVVETTHQPTEMTTLPSCSSDSR